MALTKITSHVIGSGAVTAASLSGITTDNVSEGSSNTYFTNARARGAVSVTGGNLSYDSSTGVIQLTTDQIRTAISAGTGISISAGAISTSQDISTSATPTFGNITTTGYIAGPATFTIDPAAVGDNTGTVVIAGNLQVDGTTTTINSTTLTVDDKLVTLASGSANAAAADGAGIDIDISGVTNPSLKYDGTNDEWSFNRDVNVDGSLGIGINNPANLLHIKKTAFTRGTFEADGDYQTGIQIKRSNSSSNNTDWEIYSPSNNTDLRFYNGGDKLILDTSGRLGIGASSPSADLHIAKTSGAAVMKIGTSAAADAGIQISGYDTYLALGDATNGLQWYVWNDGPSSSSSLKFGSQALSASDWYADASQAMVITSSGKVGIGTVSPGHPLNVVNSSELQAEFSGYSHASAANNSRAASGSIRLGNGAGTTGLLIDYTDQGQTVGLIKNEYVASSSSELRLQSPFVSFYTGTSASESMRISHDGAVAIGTGGAPASGLMLDVRGNVRIGDGTTGEQDIHFVNSNTEWQVGVNNGGNGTDSNQFYFYEGGNYRLTVQKGGNVGIGTASPLERLDVRDYTGIAINSNYCHVGSTVSGAMAIFGHNIKSDSANNTIKSANTGFHSSMIKMYYNEGITFHATSGTATAGDTFYDISGTTNELMRITNSGNVGIGTTSPAAGLHVVTGGGTTPFRIQGGGNSGVNIMEVGYAGGSAGANLLVDDDGFVHVGGSDANHKGLSVKYHAANDSYSPTSFNDFSLLRLNAANAQGNYAGITYTHAGGTEFFTGLVRVGATADITDYIFQGYNGNSDAYQEYMRIHSGGQVTIPHQPAFRAYLSTEQTSNGVITTGFTDSNSTASRAYDENGDFNTSNGRFTAPVAGVYVFSIMWDSNQSQGGFDVLINGVEHVRWEPTGITNDGWESKHYSTQAKLQANDYVQLKVVHASGSYPVHQGSGIWGHWAGALIS